MKYNNMRELSVNEVQEVNGCVLPLIVAIVCADAALIGVMVSMVDWNQ